MKQRIVALLATAALVLPLAIPVFGQTAAPEFEEATLTVELLENQAGNVGRGLPLHTFAVTAGEGVTYGIVGAVAGGATGVTVAAEATDLAEADIVLEGQVLYYRGEARDFETDTSKAAGDAAEYTLAVSATNFFGSATVNVSVQLTNVNEAPAATNAIPGQTAIENGPTIRVNLLDVDPATDGAQPAFTDPDEGDAASLAYSITSDAPTVASALLIGSSLRIKGRSVGTAFMTLQAEDPGELQAPAPQVFAVTVAANNAISVKTGYSIAGDNTSDLVPGWSWFVPSLPAAGGSFSFSMPENLGKEEEDDADLALWTTGTELHADCINDDDEFTLDEDNCNAAFFEAVDMDGANDTVTWSLSGAEEEIGDFIIMDVEADADDDVATPDQTVGLLLYTGEGLDFETKRAYTMSVTVTDAAGASNSQSLTIAVSNVTEPPLENPENEFPDLKLNMGDGLAFIPIVDHFVVDEITRSSLPVNYGVKPDSTPSNAIVDMRLFGEGSATQIYPQIIAQGETTVSVCASISDRGDPTMRMIEDPDNPGTMIVSAVDMSDPRDLNEWYFDDCASGYTDDEDPENDTAAVAEFDVVVGPPDQFGDDNENIHQININKVAEYGITTGCNPPDNTNYCPDNPVTRAQMATFLKRAVGLPDAAESDFTDISGNQHAADIRSLAAAEISGGCNPPTNNRYCPDRAVTRSEMATFLVRAFDLPASNTTMLTDIEGNTHEANIRALAAAGVTRGCNAAGTEFCPDRDINRAEMASFLIRAIEPDEG